MSDPNNPYLPPKAAVADVPAVAPGVRPMAAFTLANMSDLPAGVSMRGDVSAWWLATILVPSALPVAVVVLLFGPGRAWFAPRE